MKTTGGTRIDKAQRKPWRGSKWIRPAKRLSLYLRDGFRCSYCGEDLRGAAPDAITLDHLVPRCEGGSNHETNLVTACRSCNSARGAKPWTEYATGGAVARIERQVVAALNLPLAKAILSGEAGDAEVEAAR